MTFDTFIALLIFSFVTSITPGPNNFMVLASGVNFGFRRTIPHMLGIGFGFSQLLLAVGAGLGAILTAVPGFYLALKITGAAYLLYLAWRLAFSRGIGEGGKASGRPMTFWEAVAFQWVNPKGWIMAVTGMALYTNLQSPYQSVMLVSAVFALVNLPCVSSWAVFGVGLKTILSDPTSLKWFNAAMGIALALTLWPMLK